MKIFKMRSKINWEKLIKRKKHSIKKLLRLREIS